MHTFLHIFLKNSKFTHKKRYQTGFQPGLAALPAYRLKYLSDCHNQSCTTISIIVLINAYSLR